MAPEQGGQYQVSVFNFAPSWDRFISISILTPRRAANFRAALAACLAQGCPHKLGDCPWANDGMTPSPLVFSYALLEGGRAAPRYIAELIFLFKGFHFISNPETPDGTVSVE